MASVHKVSEVNRYIKACFDGEPNLRNITVQGEISNFKRNFRTGHCYFSLKEGNSVLACAMFNGNAQYLKFQPKDGMQVLATGNITVYEVSGVYQLVIRKMIPDGIGELALAFEQLRDRLTAEGLFDEAHKKPLPRFSRLIGVVTSATGAVIRDIYRVSKARDPYSRIVLYPAQVQGEGSAQQIVDGIRFFNEHYPVDVLIVGRGGGSAEDLWCFNEEPVIRAIYNSQIPVISAVGHETDFTLADFVADKRAATPSNAAEMATADVRSVIRGVEELRWRMTNSSYRSLNFKRQQLLRLAESTALRFPERLLEARQQRLDNLTERLGQSVDNAFKDKAHKLDILMEKLELMNPMKVLRRGYSMVQKSDGQVVKSIKMIKKDEPITVRLSDGSLSAQVVAVNSKEDV